MATTLRPCPNAPARDHTSRSTHWARSVSPRCSPRGIAGHPPSGMKSVKTIFRIKTAIDYKHLVSAQYLTQILAATFGLDGERSQFSCKNIIDIQKGLWNPWSDNEDVGWAIPNLPPLIDKTWPVPTIISLKPCCYLLVWIKLYNVECRGRASSAFGFKFWWRQDLGSNPGLAGRSACVLAQDT